MPQKRSLRCDLKDNFSNKSASLLGDSQKEAGAGAAEKGACSMGTWAKVKDHPCTADFLFDVHNLKEMDGGRANVSSSNDYVTLGLYRKVIAPAPTLLVEKMGKSELRIQALL